MNLMPETTSGEMGVCSSSNLKSRLIFLLSKYNTQEIARRRILAKSFEGAYGAWPDFERDAESISQLTESIVDYSTPIVSIVFPMYNEEIEIVPTVLCLLLGILESNLPSEIIAVDNGSSDRSVVISEKMGIKVVSCETPGVRFARARGLYAVNDSAKYVWMIDADTRIFPPLRWGNKALHVRNPLDVSWRVLNENNNCIATSTGIQFEYQNFTRKLINRIRLLLLGGRNFACWSGANQFIEKRALLDSGGIDLEVDGGEDQNRTYQLVRYAKTVGKVLRGADKDGSLFAPVYTSDRRNATFSKIVRNLVQQIKKPRYERDDYGLPIHPKGVRYKDLARRDRGRANFNEHGEG